MTFCNPINDGPGKLFLFPLEPHYSTYFMTQLQNSVILLTGAAGGFGQQFTRQLLKAKSHLILTDIDEQLLQEKTTPIQQEITTGKIIACWGIDLSTPQGRQALYEAVETLIFRLIFSLIMLASDYMAAWMKCPCKNGKL